MGVIGYKRTTVVAVVVVVVWFLFKMGKSGQVLEISGSFFL